MSNEVVDLLRAEFPQSVIKKLSKGGRSFDYVPIAEVIARLNSVLGVDKWGESDTEVWRDHADPDWVLARTTVWIMTPDGRQYTKTGFGGQKIKRTKNGDVVDLGDEFKGAHSDAFKKACTKLGVGLHLARDEAAIFAEAEEERSRAPIASEEVIEVLQSAIEALTDEEKEALKRKWGQERLPKLTGGEFTVEHARLAAPLLGVSLP